jgi:hypothetical protein
LQQPDSEELAAIKKLHTAVVNGFDSVNQQQATYARDIKSHSTKLQYFEVAIFTFMACIGGIYMLYIYIFMYFYFILFILYLYIFFIYILLL